MTSPLIDDASPEVAGVPAQSNRRFYSIIAALVVVWALVLLLRPPIQARYFAWQLMREHGQGDAYRHYFERMVALRDHGVAGARMLLESDDARHREMGAQVLRFVSPDAGRSLLLECLTDSEDSVRRAAALSLARDDSSDVVNAFRQMLSDPDEATAALGAGMLGRVGGDEAETALREALAGDALLSVKAEAIDGLGQMRDRTAIDLIVPALEDDRRLARLLESDRLAIEALSNVDPKLLGELPPDASALDLIEVPSTVFEVAARALERITDQLFGFRADLPASERQAVIAKWREFIENDELMSASSKAKHK